MAGRPVPAGNLHVTAAFLGAVSEARVATLQALCGPVPPLTLRFDRLEHWPKPKVLVAGTAHVPDDAQQLVDGLWRRLDRLGFSREPRPWNPHVTLVRDIRAVRPGLPWKTLSWPVGWVRLVESVATPEGVAYVPCDGVAGPA